MAKYMKLVQELAKEVDTIAYSSERIDLRFDELHKVQLELEALLDHVAMAKDNVIDQGGA